MYIEVDRADAKARAELVAELHRVLADVRAAVADWRAMQATMHAQADDDRRPRGRGAAALVRRRRDDPARL